MVSLPAEYQWSSYGAFLGKYEAPRFLETSWLLSNFGRTKKEAKRNYRDFVEKVDIKALENPSKQVTEGFLLGDADFANWVKETFLTGRNDKIRNQIFNI